MYGIRISLRPNHESVTMPSLSHRASSLGQSPIRSLAPFARAAKEKGVTVHHLNIGQPDIPTPGNAIQNLRNYDNDTIKYGDSEGSLSLRKTVAAYYQQYTSDLSHEHILVTTGASEAISMALSVCFNEGDELIIPEPFYANYLGFAHVSGVRLVAVASSIENGFALPHPSEFEKLITPRTKGIFLCNPGNPTGCLYTVQELEAIAGIVADYDLFLLVDEVYREFCYDTKFTSVLNFTNVREQVLVIDSISKVFSACGARVGFLVTRNKILLQAILKYAELRLCPPAIGQYIAEACFQDRHGYLSAVKKEYQDRRDYLYSRLIKMPGVKCYKPGAAFYIMAELPIDDCYRFAKWMLSDFSYKGQTVMIAPGAGFYYHGALGKKQVRIAFILGVEALAQAMDCFEYGLLAYSKILVGDKLYSES